MSSHIKYKHWFPHPANLRNDRRMKRAMKDLPGAVGYGAIVLVMEVLRCEPEYKYPVRDLDLLASEFDISLPILQTVIANYGFFKFYKDANEDMFISPLLNELMIPYHEKQKQNKIAGEISAQKRKIKQEQQLYVLSQLCSIQQVFDDCTTGAQENREENNTIDKNRGKNNLSVGNFQIFKKFVLEHYKNQIVCFGPLNYSSTTSISLNSLGFLHNDFNHKDLDSKEAILIWQWMFEHQNKLCKVKIKYD
jgi:hypothetical protein